MRHPIAIVRPGAWCPSGRVGTGLGAVAVPLDQPVFVVAAPEVDKGSAEILDGVEGPDPEQVLLQRPDKPLGAAVALGGADEGRGGAAPSQAISVFSEVSGHVLAARSSSVAVRYPSSAPRPWSAAGRSSRRAHPAPATSGPPTRHRERCRASRSKPPPSPPAPAQRSPAARPAAPAAPRRASAQPSSAAPAPEPRPLRFRGLRAPGSSPLNVIHLNTPVGSH